jgi:hypothetical protein
LKRIFDEHKNKVWESTKDDQDEEELLTAVTDQ